MDVLDRIIAYTEFKDCWIWTRSVADGYGQISVTPRPGVHTVQKVHIVAWELLVAPLPSDATQLDHVVCNNRRCWNPDHLEPVDASVNQRRRQGWYQTADGSWFCSEDHEITPDNIYTFGTKIRCKACKKEYYRGRIRD